MKKIEELKALEAKATAGPWVASRYDWPDGSFVMQFETEDGYIACTEDDFHCAAAFRSAAPALLALAETVKAAVEAGAVDEIYLSLLRDQLAALEDAR